ncbi:nucleotide exchange factor GrpE [Arthrobacter agilis]|uniref:nucleotide exchange factor GrpE n=1 Tax=Arthrobacter agilis TaxID=37921 RepID=UPI000B354A8B|nr:nucleotide exchange factor GrpE [Arthrobacter agilis]OUM43084.1 nucleotide exchange factor GrpE [Arthrobacter agilis]PPB46028.1 nucleotide exchange factor GrpE [Arthrobacter agilis]TPV25570.1 nucleotide exchange factor GrpE [Arthrobacter agilis]VDR33333.1 Heat shock protein B25.3 [Arthrobacter agilis]
MPHHGNEEDHQSEPVSFRDNRKIDPETGEVRGQQNDAGAPAAEESAAGGPAGPTDDTSEGDALAQAEAILNEAGAEGESNPAVDVVAELRDDLLRLQAEYVNYRRRVERDRDVARDQAVIGVLNSLMPVLDDIDAARQHGDLADGPFAAIAGKLENVLRAYELTRIDEVGVAFDPNVHEALMQQPSADVQTDSVSQILRAGYRKGERVLRAAQVIVAVPE